MVVRTSRSTSRSNRDPGANANACANGRSSSHGVSTTVDPRNEKPRSVVASNSAAT
jgi:hypothetical protein